MSSHDAATIDDRDRATDPVCGMQVDPAATRHHAAHAGTTFHFCSAGCRDKFVADADRYLTTRDETARRHCRHLHLPDASRSAADRPWQLPDLRHGAGATDRLRRDGGQSGTGRHETAPLDRRRAHRPCRRLAHDPSWVRHQLAATHPGDAGRAVGRPAVLPPGLGVAASAQPEHVHADRAWVLERPGSTALSPHLAPNLFPAGFHSAHGGVAVYFEAAAVITVLVLLGQVLELRAREQTGGAIRALLNLAPENSAPRHRRRRR